MALLAEDTTDGGIESAKCFLEIPGLQSTPPRAPWHPPLDACGRVLEKSANKVWSLFLPADKLWWQIEGYAKLYVTNDDGSCELEGLPLAEEYDAAGTAPPKSLRLMMYDLWGSTQVESLAWWEAQAEWEKKHVRKVTPSPPTCGQMPLTSCGRSGRNLASLGNTCPSGVRVTWMRTTSKSTCQGTQLQPDQPGGRRMVQRWPQSSAQRRKNAGEEAHNMHFCLER